VTNRDARARLEALGAALRRPDADPGWRAARARAETQSAIRELGEVLETGLTREQREYLERDARAAMAGAGKGRSSGWKNGTPQCSSCRKILSAYNAPCACGGYSQGSIGSRGRGGR
jgi:hypothetical protein